MTTFTMTEEKQCVPWLLFISYCIGKCSIPITHSKIQILEPKTRFLDLIKIILVYIGTMVCLCNSSILEAEEGRPVSAGPILQKQKNKRVK